MGVVWFRADLLSGVTLHYISLLSVISEMHEIESQPGECL